MLPAIEVLNFVNGEVISYPLVIIKGKIKQWAAKNKGSKCDLHVSTNKTDLSWPVLNNKFFKAIVLLKLGKNEIQLSYADSQRSFSLTYTPAVKETFVRLIYIVCNNSNGQFQTIDQNDNSISSAKARLGLGARIIQSIAAEKLHEHNLTRRTFTLEEEPNGEVICHTFVSKLSTEEVHSMNGEELWSHFAKELMSSSLSQGQNVCKFLAFLSATTYTCPDGDPPTKHVNVIKNTKGHVALGGGGLALFGTGCLYTWANNLMELKQKLTDERLVDRSKVMDDSCNRGTYWGCYSSGLGAILHELAHAFDLGHSKKGIMGLGFHEIRKELITMDEVDLHKCCVCAKTKTRQNTVELSWTLKFEDNIPEKIDPLLRCSSCGDGCFWTRSQAYMLFFHRWFRPKGLSLEIVDKPTNIKGSLILSESGYQLIEIRTVESGMYLFHSEHLQYLSRRVDLKSLLVSVPDKNKTVSLVIQNRSGEVHKYEIDVKTATVIK